MNDEWRIKVLYDGDCPLCTREISFLSRRDRGAGLIQFEDIASGIFDPAKYGLDHQVVMARIHGVLPDGTVVEGIEVFRRAYDAVGLGWLWAPTRWPFLRPLAERAYQIFARNRLRWTGRDEACDSGQCQAPGSPSRSPKERAPSARVSDS
jgi:predicted DCC family thiol-disulfide oxidoreductase YuxK